MQHRFNNRQIAKNIASNAVVMLISVATGLWLTPYLIHNVGLAMYGMVAMAISVTNYMIILNTVLDTSLGRYLSIDINSNDLTKANATFNTAFWTAVALSAALLPGIVYLSHIAPAIFDVPPGEEQPTSLLFLFVPLAFVLVLFRSVFASSAYALNRLDYKNLPVACNSLLRVAFVILIFKLASEPKVWHIGLSILLATIASVCLAIWVWRRLTPEINVRISDFCTQRLREMIGMSGWLMINQAGAILFLNIDLLVINLALGAKASGGYASVLQLAVLLRTTASVLASAITPVAIRHHSKGDRDAMIKMTHSAIRWMGLLMALPIGAVAGSSALILTLWLGRDFQSLSPLLIALTLHLCINLPVLPLFSSQIAMNKVRAPGLVTLCLGGLNLLLATWWVRFDTQGLGVALAGATVLTVKNAIFVPTYGARIQGLPWYSFIIDIIPGVFATTCFVPIFYFLSNSHNASSGLVFVLHSTMVAAFYSVLLFYLVLSRRTREWVINRTMVNFRFYQ